MNYYIQGNAANADQIKAAFEKLGYNTAVNGWNFNSDCGVYFTNESDKTIDFTHIEVFVNLIKTHPDYKEPELPVEPKLKVGDWVVFNNNHNSIYQISEIKDSYYMLTHTHGGSMPLSFSQEEFIRPWTIADAKDGDVLVTEDYIFIFKHILHGGVHLYCHYNIDDEEFDSDIPDAIIGNIHDKGAHFQPATKEQRDLLFRKMEDAGYTWDDEKKELNKIQPHYDIANFHAGMPVLVRADNNCKWDYSVFSRITGNEDWQFAVCNGVSFTQCIPFEGNEHLLGTTNSCDERFINW